MEIKQQVTGWVREIDELRIEISDHWSMAQKCVEHECAEEAISILNRYFHLKERLAGVEARLGSALLTNFSEK
jgi:hypothetical protein